MNRWRFGWLEILFLLLAGGYLAYGYISTRPTPQATIPTPVARFVAATPTPFSAVPAVPQVDPLVVLESEILLDIPSLILRAGLRAEQGDLTGAIADYTTILLIDPSLDRYYKSRADLYAQLGLYDLAIADYQSAQSLWGTPEVQFRLGMAYLNSGNLAEAQSAVNRIALASTVRRRLEAEIAMTQGDPQTAYDLFRDLATQTESAADYTRLADAAVRQEIWRLAVMHYERALEIEPNYAPAITGLAVARYRWVAGTAAINYETILALTNALRLDLLNTELLTYRGVAYLELGEPQRAAADLQVVYAAFPDYPNVALALGEAYLQLGDVEQAIAVYERSRELLPNNLELRDAYDAAILNGVSQAGITFNPLTAGN